MHGARMTEREGLLARIEILESAIMDADFSYAGAHCPFCAYTQDEQYRDRLPYSTKIPHRADCLYTQLLRDRRGITD